MFTSRNATIELLNPFNGAVLKTVTGLTGINPSEAPEYAGRSYARSGATAATRTRSKGGVSIKLTPETLELVEEIKRIQKGLTVYQLASDLKGKTYQHPDLRLKMTNLVNGVTEVFTAHGIKLSSRSFDLPLSGPATDTIQLEVLRGFNLSAAEQADQGAPVRALALHRTGSATYVGLDGQLKTAGDGVARVGLPGTAGRRNLATNTVNLLSSPWATVNSSLYANQALDPFGGYGAVKLTENSANAQHWFGNSSNIAVASGSAYTFSVFATPGSRSIVWLMISDGTPRYAWFNLATGATGATSGAGITASITVDRNGFYRCSATLTVATTALAVGCGLAPASGTHTYAGDGSSYAYFFGLQVDLASTATPYQPTNATGVDLTNPLNGPGLVLEGLGANLLTYSEQFNNAAWIKANATVTPNTVNAPDGTTTADTIDSTAAGGFFYQNPGIDPAGKTYTLSVWLMCPSSQTARLSLSNNVDSGPFASVKVTSDWKRFTFTATFNGTPGNLSAVIYPVEGGTGRIYAWGAQLEQSPFATSYIPTTNTAVTRQPDLCGIVQLHNLLKWSEGFDNSVWTKAQPWDHTITGGFTAPDGTNTARKVVQNATSWTSVLTQYAGPVSSAKTFTASVWMRADAPTTVTLSSVAGATSQSFTLGTTWQRFKITYTAGTGATADIHLSSQNITNNTYYVWGAQLTEGYHPGIYCRTTDTPIPAPTSPALDPAWQQNGAVEFEYVAPYGPISHPTFFPNIFGAEPRANVNVGTLRFYKAATADHSAAYDRKHNGATGSLSTAGRGLLQTAASNPALFDGAKHRIRLEWTNEINEATGVREMWQRLYVDGVLVAQQDVAAIYGATAWATIDPSRLVSDGSVFATLSNIVLSYPPLPSGAIPAT